MKWTETHIINKTKQNKPKGVISVNLLLDCIEYQLSHPTVSYGGYIKNSKMREDSPSRDSDFFFDDGFTVTSTPFPTTDNPTQTNVPLFPITG